MKKFVLNVVFFLSNIALSMLLFTVVSAFSIKYTFMDPVLNAGLSEILPVKVLVEDSIEQEVGVKYVLQEIDEQLIKKSIASFLYDLTVAVNKNEPLNFDIKSELTVLAENINDPNLKKLLVDQLINNPELNAEINKNPEYQKFMNQSTAIKSGINYFVYIYFIFAILAAVIMIAIDQRKALKTMFRTFMITSVTILALAGFLIYVSTQKYFDFDVVNQLINRATVGLVVFGVLYGIISLGLRHYLRHNYQD